MSPAHPSSQPAWAEPHLEPGEQIQQEVIAADEALRDMRAHDAPAAGEH